MHITILIMLTASLVTYHNSFEEVERLVDCVLQSPIDRLYIIDNSQTDIFKYLGARSEKIFYTHGENVGYGRAHNVALREAIKLKANYHVVLNPDIYFESGTIESLAEYLDNNSDVGQVMPKVFYPNGNLQYLCKMVPTPMDLIFKRFLPKRLTRKSMYKFQLRFTGYDKIMNVPYLSGCFMMFRVSALEKVGLFDERFFMYPEDIDMTRRMHEKYKTIFYPYVSIIHAHGAASKSSMRMLKVHIVNMIKYFNKWGWVFDKRRREINARLLKELNYK